MSPAPCCPSCALSATATSFTISSLAGAVGQEFCVAYAAVKFGVEGFMESLSYDGRSTSVRQQRHAGALRDPHKAPS
ncbi:SDR family NAD(P)-dependent oxidoreductase [Streptomyces sp. NPDC002928]|uniref:SDR family NAD(P)-dependent oxidoreductase n=1 Tax=Streptomyces sp. NPDC002928 TaxID=3154440 RepID=UPI0033BCDC13